MNFFRRIICVQAATGNGKESFQLKCPRAALQRLAARCCLKLIVFIACDARECLCVWHNTRAMTGRSQWWLSEYDTTSSTHSRTDEMHYGQWLLPNIWIMAPSERPSLYVRRHYASYMKHILIYIWSAYTTVHIRYSKILHLKIVSFGINFELQVSHFDCILPNMFIDWSVFTAKYG